MLNSIFLIAVSFAGTGINFWVLLKGLKKRECLQKKQYRTMWLFYTFIMFYVGLNTYQFLNVPILCTVFLYIAGIFSYVIYAKWVRRTLHVHTVGWVEQIIKIFFIFATACLFVIDNWHSYISVAMVWIVSIAIPWLMITFYDCEYIKECILELWYLAIVTLFKLIFFMYISLAENLVWEENTMIHSYMGNIYILTINIGIMLLIRHTPLLQMFYKALERHKKEWLIVGNEILCIALIVMSFPKYNITGFAVLLIVTVSLIVAILSVVAYSMWKSSEMQKQFLDMRNTVMDEQYKELREAYEHNRCMIHDEKHMVAYLKECLENGDVQQACSFLDSFERNQQQGARQFWTGISTVDFMLTMKKRKMDQLSIKFQLDVDFSNIPLEDADFVVLLGNLFDNAIEAAEKCQLEERSIKLLLKEMNQMFMLRMENSCVEQPEMRKGRFITSKKDRQNHGWGVESVKHIINKYNGDIIFKFEEQIFFVDVVIQ